MSETEHEARIRRTGEAMANSILGLRKACENTGREMAQIMRAMFTPPHPQAGVEGGDTNEERGET